MEKWADKLIVAVRFNRAHTHIDRIQYRKDNGETVDSEVYELTRLEVLSQLSSRITFLTIYRGDDLNGKKMWRYGAPVKEYPVGRNTFIRTNPDAIEKDNLDSLPEF